MKYIRNLLLLSVAVMVLPFAMTSSICHARFFWAWNEMGQCASTDAPSEVFMGSLVISLFVWSVVLIVFGLAKYSARKPI